MFEVRTNFPGVSKYSLFTVFRVLGLSWQELKTQTEKIAHYHENISSEYSRLAEEMVKFVDDLKLTYKPVGKKSKPFLLMGIWYTFRGKGINNLGRLPFEKRSTLKGKNLLPLGANSFLLE